MNDLGNVVAIVPGALGAAFFAFVAFVIWWMLRYIVVRISSRNQPLNYSTQAQSFQAPNRSKFVWALATIVFLTLGVFFISIPFVVELPPTNPTDSTMSSRFYWFWGALSLVAAVWCVQIIWDMRYSVGIDENGIFSTSPNSQDNRINWQEIEKVRDQRLLGRLKITSRDSRKSVGLVYQLENFDDVLTQILQKVTDFDPPIELPKRFKNRGYPITVTDQECRIYSQPENQTIQFESIASVNIGRASEDSIFNYLSVWFVTDTGSTVPLKTYGNEVELFQTMYYAWSKVKRPTAA